MAVDDSDRVRAEPAAPPVAVVTVGADDRISSFDEGATRLVGYRADEVVGGPAAALFDAGAPPSSWGRRAGLRSRPGGHGPRREEARRGSAPGCARMMPACSCG